MLRYLTLPAAPLDLYYPSGEKADNTVTHRDVVGLLFQDQRLSTAPMDIFGCYDLRKKLLGEAGTVVELSEQEHAALVAVCKDPKTMNQVLALQDSVIAFLRSVVDAPSVAPAPSVKP